MRFRELGIFGSFVKAAYGWGAGTGFKVKDLDQSFLINYTCLFSAVSREVKRLIRIRVSPSSLVDPTSVWRVCLEG